MRISRICHFIAVAAFSAVLVGGCSEQNNSSLKEAKVKEIDLSQFKDSKPERKLRLLFIHHSTGGHWLSDKGIEKMAIPETCIYVSHPNGGGLRAVLTENNYEVHEAAYKSSIGDKTDICDWNAKFRDKMGAILRCDIQDSLYNDPNSKNEIIMFKSCFPANGIESEGNEPGDPDSPIKTIANYKAAYQKLLGYFNAHPDTLFVCVTAPPLVETYPSRLKEYIKRAVAPDRTVKAMGERARQFNNWLKDVENGWLKGYEGNNVVVFDYYDVLTKHGLSNFALYPTQGGTDSHPSAEGNLIAAKELVPFLNKAVNRFRGLR